MSENFINQLFSLDGQSAAVIGGTGVLGFALGQGAQPSRDARHRRRHQGGSLQEPRSGAAADRRPRGGAARSMSPSGRRSRTCWPPRSSRPAGPTSSSIVPAWMWPTPSSTPPTPTGTASWRSISARSSRAARSSAATWPAPAAGPSSTSAASRRTCLCPGFSPIVLEGRGAQSHPQRGPRVRPVGRAGERDLPRLLSRRTEPQDSRQRAGRQHHARHAHEAFRRAGRTGRRVLLLLAAPKAGAFITGTHINVDGGFTAAWF